MKYLLAAAALVLLLAPQANAQQRCWWTPAGWVCPHGFRYEENREWREREWRHRERERERERYENPYWYPR